VEAILHNIAAQAATLTPILYGLLIAALLDTLSGIYAAVNAGTFSGQYLAEFVRAHLLQRITPILLGLVAGVAVGGTDSVAGVGLITAAGAGGVAYLGETVASIMSNLGPAKVAGNLPRGIVVAPVAPVAPAAPRVATPKVREPRP
jgi:hypothetical protein